MNAIAKPLTNKYHACMERCILKLKEEVDIIEADAESNNKVCAIIMQA